MNLFNIGEAAKRSGIHIKMIRYYEEQGLLSKIKRTQAGYRIYDAVDVQNLLFIKRARELGFAIVEIKKLLDLWKNKKRSSAEVKKISEQHIKNLQIKIAEIQTMIQALEHLVSCCQGDERPDCPILDGISLGK